MGRKHGYVYYEADCFFMFSNPFVDPNIDEPTLAMGLQKPLKVYRVHESQNTSIYYQFWLIVIKATFLKVSYAKQLHNSLYLYLVCILIHSEPFIKNSFFENLYFFIFLLYF